MELHITTNLQGKKLSKGEKIISGSCIAALISLFLPWQELGLLGSLLGISDYAWLPFLLGWGLPMYMIFKRVRGKTIFVFGGNLVAFIWGIAYILQAKVENPLTDETICTASWGAVIFCMATLALGVGIILDNKVKSAAELMNMVQEDINSLKTRN